MKASALAIAATLGLSLGAHAQGTYPEKPGGLSSTPRREAPQTFPCA